MKSPCWVRDPDNPILPVMPGTWRGSRVANCCLLIRSETAYLYYRAGLGVWWQGTVGHEAIGLATCPVHDFDGKTWHDYPYNPIFTHGAPGIFTSAFSPVIFSSTVLEPGTTRSNATIWMPALLVTGTENSTVTSIGPALSVRSS